MNTSPLPICFVAYPSSPADRAESIETAIREIESGGVVDIRGWKSLSVGGRLVVGAVCDQIRTCQLFIADATGLNPNVMFELGYAIAHRKRVWLLLNPKITRARLEWDRFQLLSTVGFAPYANSREIVEQFYRGQPYQSIEQNLYDDVTRTGTPGKRDVLLYLRPDVDTDASIRVARRIAAGPIRSIIDDPQEVRVQPLAWYVQQVTSSFGVVCHLLSNEYQNWQLHNAKQALIAGLSYGRSKPLLMLAHEPYESPLDYRDLLRTHRTAAAADSIFADWSLPLIEQYEKRLAQEVTYKLEERAHTGLRRITVGEPVAEFEAESIPDYFVSTAAYSETLQSKHSIVVGRKGTGKTATLYALADGLAADPRNHVCVIKPVGYELEGLMDILRQELPRAELGYLVESFWKFLLYTELAKSVYEQLIGKPAYYVRSSHESALCEFVEQYRSLISPEFSSRLEAAVSRLSGLSATRSAEGRRLKISELLHNEMLATLRALLGRVLHSRAKVAILVDNLDKAWNRQVDLPLLSDLLFGLLTGSQRAAEDFARDASGLASVNLSFALFLRSDIYVAMLQFVKERDKLPVRVITWVDPTLLKRVIERRFMVSARDIAYPHDVWDRYFIPTVRGVPTWEYIGSQILPRPRDLIFLIRSALQFAVNRGRMRVEEGDLLDAEKQYSRFALDALIVEAGVRIENVEEMLLHFVQSSEIVDEREIENRLVDARIPLGQLEAIICLLAELTFLGFEVSPNRFEFLYDEQDERKFVIMSQKTAHETTNDVRRFRIHPAFHAFLEIKPNSSTTPGQMTIGL